MNVSLKDVRHAAELVSFGLRHGARPTDGNPYGLLLHRYRTEAAFRDTVDVLASGLGLNVLGTPARTGIVVTTQPGSVFAIRTADLRSTKMSQDDKLVARLITLAIAAYAFPHPRDPRSTWSPGATTGAGKPCRARRSRWCVGFDELPRQPRSRSRGSWAATCSAMATGFSPCTMSRKSVTPTLT